MANAFPAGVDEVLAMMDMEPTGNFDPLAAAGTGNFNPSQAIVAAGMEDERFDQIVREAIEDAVMFIDSYIAPEREKASAYYEGSPLGNEEEGRSQLVMREVADVVDSVKPSLMRIFAGGDTVVDYEPVTPDDEEGAAQATDYVNFVFSQDNPGYQVTYNAITDALVRKTGIFKWYPDTSYDVKEEDYSGLSNEQAVMLEQDPEVEILQAEHLIETDEYGIAIDTINLRIKRTRKNVRVRVESLPCEEFICSVDAIDEDNATLIGQRKMATVSELVAMGYPLELVTEYGGVGDAFDNNLERFQRNPALSRFDDDNSMDLSANRVLYVEAYIKVDKDGDGIAELRKVCTIGGNYKLVHEEVVSDRPFAVICPYPEPHTMIGMSLADKVMDIQRVKTGVMRNMMDSLAQSIHPRTAVVENQVNLDDVMNNETGAIIRMKQAGAVTPFATPFVGASAQGILDYLDQIKTARTGISQASRGLDANTLTNQTATGVAATVSASQDSVELIARNFAETGFKRLFKGLLKTIIQHQDKPRMIRLRGKWVEVDPRTWNAEMDARVNVALGRGTETQKLAMLMQIKGAQEQIVQALGPGNPLVGLSEYRNTLDQILTLAGFKDTSRFFKEVDEQQAAQMMQPKPDPAQILAQIEAQKAQVDMAIAQDKMRLEWEKAKLQDDRERDQLDADIILKAAEIYGKYQQQVDVAQIKADIQRDRDAMRAATSVPSIPLQQSMPPVMPQ
jgi:hypothetical protein